MALREETALENDVPYGGSIGRVSFTGPIQSFSAPQSVSVRRNNVNSDSLMLD